MCDTQDANFSRSIELDDKKTELNGTEKPPVKRSKLSSIRHSQTLIPRMIKHNNSQQRLSTTTIDSLPVPTETKTETVPQQLKSYKNYKNNTLINTCNNINDSNEEDDIKDHEQCKIESTPSAIFDLLVNQSTSTINFVEEGISVETNTSYENIDFDEQKPKSQCVDVETNYESSNTPNFECKGCQTSDEKIIIDVPIKSKNIFKHICCKANQLKILIIMLLLCTMTFIMVYLIALKHKEHLCPLMFIGKDIDEDNNQPLTESDDYGLKQSESDVWLKYL